MRILHILDHSIPIQTGYTFRTLSTLEEQRRRGWETYQLTGPKQGYGDALSENVDGWHFYRTQWHSHFTEHIPLVREGAILRELTKRIRTLARDLRPDILHAHSPVLNALPALRVGRQLGIPVVYEVRAFWEDAAADHGTAREWGMRYRLTRALETYALKKAAAVTTICEGLRSELISRNIPANRITVIPNAVNLDHFRYSAAPNAGLKTSLGLQGRNVLGFVGSFYAYEGLDLLLRALPQITAVFPKAAVLLVGGGPQEAYLKEVTRKLGLENDVIFTGRVPHDQVTDYYDLIDVLVYPRVSRRLTELVTPLKPLEAMAQGRLLIASNVGGHRELIRDQETGILFTAGSESSLAEAVIQLLKHPEKWPALKTAARQYVETQRSWQLSVSRYSPLYEELVRARA
jgi:PEP-CTERM/exosortase A-associated glycosyltransferase